MANKSHAAYAADQILYSFVGECAGAEISGTTLSELETEYLEYKESLDEINSMIFYFQDMGDSGEVACWRKMLMHHKMVMRDIKKRMMDAKKIQKETVYS